MQLIHVLAIMPAKPGRRAKLLAAFKANVPNVHAEEACIEYLATVDTEGAGSDPVRRGHLRGGREMGKPRRP